MVTRYICILSLMAYVSAQTNPVVINLPLFAPCTANQRCEAGASCKFHICLPNTAPTPVVANQASLQIQKQLVAQPTQTVHEVRVAAPQASNQACAQKCIGTATCVKGSCVCGVANVAYNPSYGCVIPPNGRRPALAVPIPGFLPPQAIPGEKCDPNTECTGGSVCSQGVCVCPPELVRTGAVCVSPAIFGMAHKGLPGYQF